MAHRSDAAQIDAMNLTDMGPQIETRIKGVGRQDEPDADFEGCRDQDESSREKDSCETKFFEHAKVLFEWNALFYIFW
jgi:hypothetical protein